MQYTFFELQHMDPTEARRVLLPLVEKFSDAELAERFGVSAQQVGYLRRKLGLERTRGKGGGAVITREARPAGFVPFTLSFSGRMTRDELARALEKALHFVQSVSDAGEFSVTIQVTEDAAERTQE